MNAWHSSLKNLKAICDHVWTWVTMLRKNRKVNRNENLAQLGIPDEDYLFIKVRIIPRYQFKY